MTKTRNRYGVAFAGVVLHLMIGGVYAWSVFTKPIAQQTGWREASVSFWPSSVWGCQPLSWVAWSKSSAQLLLVLFLLFYTDQGSC